MCESATSVEAIGSASILRDECHPLYYIRHVINVRIAHLPHTQYSTTGYPTDW